MLQKVVSMIIEKLIVVIISLASLSIFTLTLLKLLFSVNTMQKIDL